MSPILTVAMFSLATIVQSSPSGGGTEPQTPVTVKTPAALPSIPKGTSTAIGGEIREVDPIRDLFTLKVFGGQTLKVLFDERTQVYRDGVRIPLLTLHSEDHASVETILDGTKIFALKIHVLSQLPKGDYEGEISSYDPQSGELTIKVTSSKSLITFRVPPGTPVVHVGQDGSAADPVGPSALTRGSVIRIAFNSGKQGQGVATEVGILAAPGSASVFTGKVSFLDVHSGRLVIVSATDGESHAVDFDPTRFPVSPALREGLLVAVTAVFDGSRYLASNILVK